MLPVPVAEIDWGWWLEFLEYPEVVAFLAAALLQVIRSRVSAMNYSSCWKVLLVVSLIWGGLALVMYALNFFEWHDQKLALPKIALGIAIAKAKEWLRLIPYLMFLAFTLIVWQYGESVIDYFRLTFFVSENPLTERRSGGGYGLVGLGISASLYWLIFLMPGLALLAGALAVPPRTN